ncbi:MAG TPA: hypothetical protein VF848_11790 [Steroidobacteraceae bacterium]
MQQASQPTLAPAPVDGSQSPPAQGDALFVINLSASTTPMALTSPERAELRHFTFFVSRRREEGRERFRLHMGYFQSQAEAEKLLDLVRDIYPGAWAGLAPGQRLRGASKPLPSRAGPPPATPFAEPRHQREVPPASAAPRLQVIESPAVAAPPVPPAPAAVTRPAAPRELPVLHAAPQPATAKIPVLAAAPKVAAPSPPAAAVSPARPAPAPAKQAGDTVAQTRPHIVPPALIEALTSPTDETAAYSLSSVRAAIASLTEADRQAPPAATSPAAPVAKSAVALQGEELLKLLEPAITNAPAAALASHPEPTLYAVQMMWSVKPIDLAKVPQLAIFSAYTLYGAEGNRDGRRWYGLRLGFFTDAYSARQVALYVRPEFSAVSVVPVSMRESERAKNAVAKPLPELKAAPANINSSGEFKFLEPTAPKPRTPAPAPAKPAARAAGGKRAKPRGAQAHPAARPRALSLEETLEILGANTLEIEQGNGQVLNDSGVRHLHAEIMKNRRGSKLGRLFERLGGALRE